MDMVRRALELGFIVGSASDRPIPVQKMLWERAGVDVSFTINKHRLDVVRAEFEADLYEHIGDTNMDEMYAKMHGFEYWDVAKFTAFPWMLDAAEASGPEQAGAQVAGADIVAYEQAGERPA
jgi:hypothetical protein